MCKASATRVPCALSLTDDDKRGISEQVHRALTSLHKARWPNITVLYGEAVQSKIPAAGPCA